MFSNQAPSPEPVAAYEPLQVVLSLRTFDSRKRRAGAADAEHVERLIASVLARDSLHLRQAVGIRSRQNRLKLRVSPAAWRLYLLLEEAEVERWSYVIERVAERVLVPRRGSRKS
ncbi:MAG TPA: hypothetical protein VK745_27920 [Polyangiaceae bacterium]|jgi:hypothetical protein|nr:hypothetical protein [Polyangiaceae bacterium]